MNDGTARGAATGPRRDYVPSGVGNEPVCIHPAQESIMAKRVFISFSFVAERGLLNDLLQFFQENGGPVKATPAYMKQDFSSRGEEFVKARIREQMTGCVALIVLVGDEAHNSNWIRYEGGVANELHVPKFGMRHPSKRGGFPKAHEGMREIPWSPTELAKVIEELPS